MRRHRRMVVQELPNDPQSPNTSVSQTPVIEINCQKHTRPTPDCIKTRLDQHPRIFPSNHPLLPRRTPNSQIKNFFSFRESILSIPKFPLRNLVFVLKAPPLLGKFTPFFDFPTPSSSKTMKIHPVPTKKRNITIQTSSPSSGSLGKRLRRLPHIFSRVLELPFRSDADVEVEERPEFFRFVAETDGLMGSDVIAHMVEIYPGVAKIVVRPRPRGGVVVWDLDSLELDMWRFRLPESTRPELASAVCVDGELIVTVPKDEEEYDGDVWGGGGMGNRNNSGRLVIVQ